MLHLARVKHPYVVRVAYRTSDSCQGPELSLADEVVSWPANVTALIQALDRAVRRIRRAADRDAETPSSANLQAV
jgi:hypothetical protein